ncbi:hypothetical protein V6R21_12640 [Limibacter armeniacum]|uniref:baeRF7 domain-containing protein n=1 Tax=Limibacter armeniacum TaxID=466084 RepID=UPI002FE6044F
MKLFSENKFKELAKIRDKLCMTIYIPTSRAGKRVLEGEGKIRLRNQLKKVEKMLDQKGLDNKEREQFMEPVVALLDDHVLWHHLSDCLVIFRTSKMMTFHTLPIETEEMTYMSDRLYLTPLIPLINGVCRFFILSLNQNNVKFFEGTRYSIADVYIEDIMPQRLAETERFTEKERSLQHHSSGGTVYHGQGKNKDYKEIELENFLREVDKGMMKMLHDEDAPLVIAATPNVASSFMKICSYPHVHKRFITGNHEGVNRTVLHEKALRVLQPVLDTGKLSILRNYKKLQTKGKTTAGVWNSLPKALDGRVEALLINKTSKDIFGYYEEKTHSVSPASKSKVSDPSDAENLSHMAIINTINNGGKVYMVDDRQMPVNHTRMCAILRY